jgi:hypothetical protein
MKPDSFGLDSFCRPKQLGHPIQNESCQCFEMGLSTELLRPSERHQVDDSFSLSKLIESLKAHLAHSLAKLSARSGPFTKATVMQ